MSMFLSLLLLLLAVAFFTLLERKVLSYIMLRKGPNKPSLFGLPIPFADALKLAMKPFLKPIFSSSFLLTFSCWLFFLIPCALWSFVATNSPSSYCSFSLICVLIWMSLSVYALLAAGWGSNSKYSTLGGTRCIAQCISFEVCLTLLLLCFAFTFSFQILVSSTTFMLFTSFHLVALFFVVSLAETNRSPFDFAEGESELVSGYNVEFAGPGFMILFLSEYLSILFMSYLTASLGVSGSHSMAVLGCCFFSFSFIWVRGSLPRFRYDQLMMLCWKSILPLVLISFLLLLLY